MSYRLKIYGVDGSGTPITTLQAGDFTLNGWGKAINGSRNMAFTMHKFSAKATADILQKQRHIKLLRKKRDNSGLYVPVWHGFINAERETGTVKSVECKGLLERLLKRFTGENETFNGQGSTEVFDLLDDANDVDNTGIVAGTGGVTTTRAITAQGTVTALSMIEKLALAHGAEYEVDDDRALNFVPSLGSDKSETVELIFRRDGAPGTNIDQIELGEDATNQATRLIGFNSSLTSQYDSDGDIQDKYGILVDRKQFNEAQNQDTLDEMTEAYGTQMEEPLTEFRAVPTLASKKFITGTGERAIRGLQYDDVAVGDLVTCTVVTGNNSISEVKRIAELSVSVSANNKETMIFTLSKSGVYITAERLDREELTQIKRRIQELDALL